MDLESNEIESDHASEPLGHQPNQLNYQPTKHRRTRRLVIRVAVIFLLVALLLIAMHVAPLYWRNSIAYVYKWRCLRNSNPAGIMPAVASLPAPWLHIRETAQMSTTQKQMLYLGPLVNERGEERLVAIEFDIWPRKDGTVQGMPYHYEIWNTDFAGQRIDAGGNDIYDGLPAYLFANPTYAQRDSKAANHLTFEQRWPNGFNEVVDVWLTASDKLLLEPRAASASRRKLQNTQAEAQRRLN